MPSQTDELPEINNMTLKRLEREISQAEAQLRIFEDVIAQTEDLLKSSKRIEDLLKIFKSNQDYVGRWRSRLQARRNAMEGE